MAQVRRVLSENPSKHNISTKQRAPMISHPPKNDAEHEGEDGAKATKPNTRSKRKIRTQPKAGQQQTQLNASSHGRPRQVNHKAPCLVEKEMENDWLDTGKTIDPSRDSHQPHAQVGGKSRPRGKPRRLPKLPSVPTNFPVNVGGSATESSHSEARAKQTPLTRKMRMESYRNQYRYAQSLNNQDYQSPGIKITFVKPDGEPKNSTSFLSLPRELRDMIYEAYIDLSGITENFKNEHNGFFAGMRRIDTCKHSRKAQRLMQRLAFRHGNLKTPSLLLVSHQVYEEVEKVMRSRSITFSAPAINTPDFPLSSMISYDLIRKVKSINIIMSMKQHQEAAMEAEELVGSNWYIDQKPKTNESLEYSVSWGVFLVDLIAVLWLPNDRTQRIIVSINGGKNGDREFALSATQSKLSMLDKAINTCLQSRNLDHFFRYLQSLEDRSSK